MIPLQGWHLVFVAAVLSAGAVVLGYVEIRRLLCAAVDDRYGQWARFWTRIESLGTRLQYTLAFFFCYGVHDLTRWVTLVAFDLFVIFALLAPFWRYVFFDDWNPTMAVAIALAGISVYVAWKVRQGLQLCRLHEWSPDTWQCARCGEYHAHAEQQAGRKKAPKPANVSPGFWDRLSWHGFWERRLQKMNEQLSSE